MKRFAFKMYLKPGFEKEYEKDTQLSGLSSRSRLLKAV